MRILLIGASGCFGTEFTWACKKKKIKLIYYPSKKLDVTNLINLKKKIYLLNPNVIINSSAVVGINQCEIDYHKAFKINSNSSNTVGTPKDGDTA